MCEKAEVKTHLKRYWFNAEDLLQYQKALYLSKNYTLLTEMMKRHYDNFYAEHFEYKKTFKIIWRKIFWFVIHSDIQQYVKKCEICQRIKVSRQRLYKFLAALLWFIIFFREIFLDFIIKLPSSTLNEQVYNSILIVIDCCTQILLYIFIIKIIITSVLIELLRKRVFNHFNYSDKAISD